MMNQDMWNIINAPSGMIRPSKSAPCSPIKPIAKPRLESFHSTHKVPVGDTPYVRAKRVQLVDKDPERAIALFWGAINAGDRVDSALKDMAIVMKQQNRAEEAVEAIKSLRHRCSDQSQESLDNILLDLYKRCGRLDDQIALLRHKLQLIQQGLAFNGKRTKTARSQGRKFQVSVDQEATRLLGNLGWALMQKDNYIEAEEAYRRALLIGPDNNKMCNLGICLMKQGRVVEAKETLKQVRPATVDGLRGADSHLKAFERAQEMLRDLEFNRDKFDQNWLFQALMGSSSIWQPQPCADHRQHPEKERFGNENFDVNRGGPISLNIDAPPFYSAKLVKESSSSVVHHHHHHHQFIDPIANLKRTRSGSVAEKKPAEDSSSSSSSGKWPELPENDAFDEAILAAVLAPIFEDENVESNKNKDRIAAAIGEEKMGKKRLRVFEDITLAMNSPKAKVSA